MFSIIWLSTLNLVTYCITSVIQKLHVQSKMTLRPESASEFDNLRKIILKYYLEEYFGIDVQMKVIEHEFLRFYLYSWIHQCYCQYFTIKFET
jgi:hypothetical protein